MTAATSATSTLHHVTMATGHVRESPRSEVGEPALRLLGALLRRVVNGEEADLPGPTASPLTGAAGGDCLIATVWAAADGAPLCTVGVARGDDEATHLWALLHATAVGLELVTPADQPPSAPWCAARLEVGLALHPEAAHWLGDFERCWAWAWIEHRGERLAARLTHPRRPRPRGSVIPGRAPRARR